MSFSAYLVTCLVSGHEYVGITYRDINRRWNEHIWSAKRGSSTPLARAIRKYGVDAFEFKEIAQSINLDDLLYLERVLVAQQECLVPNGYNVLLGGDFNPMEVLE